MACHLAMEIEVIVCTCGCCCGDGKCGGDHPRSFRYGDIDICFYSYYGWSKCLGGGTYCPLRPLACGSYLTMCFVG